MRLYPCADKNIELYVGQVVNIRQYVTIIGNIMLQSSGVDPYMVMYRRLLCGQKPLCFWVSRIQHLRGYVGS